ncbi:MAG: glycosyltransferase family 9 protein [Ignavibacteriales bacterium]|nr:glycosyltransferase family 9 protein [Ignavibacteriales bacterium]
MTELLHGLWQSPFVVVFKKAVLRLIHLSRLLRFYVFDTLVTLDRSVPIPRSLLVVRLEGIGDYILFRNFLKALKEHERFSHYTITLCGNESFRDFASSFDRDVIDDFIWIRPARFLSKTFYRFRTLRSIRKRGFEVALYPTLSRDTLLGDSILRCCSAVEKVGYYGDDVHAKDWERRLFNRWYTTLIDVPQTKVFEFLRNKYFFEQLLKTRLPIEKPLLRMTSEASKEKPFAVLCPDALHPKKRWRFANFLDISDYLFSRYNLSSVLVGGRQVRSVNTLKMIERRPHVNNQLGKTSLTETARLVRESSLVISNDTSVSHIGVALNKRVIVLSNGEHYGRFTYPSEVYRMIHYAFPQEISNSTDSYDRLVQRFKYGSRLDINSIKPSTVIDLVDRVLLDLNRNVESAKA